ncbi:sigma-54 dependent transcriptional regulator [Aestuariirhabdus sp. Z084]|uniref:sigma-54-dependent transcriptional regulator n=1 Tax=Aestuariirhabdus haliotis TaxID=2918751 RepID=UPI00201B38D0|nr:sigma-54 dependent transcriptional regulator [Aestuariirhabdus haliotis]MCL6416261.1 sigma-54 dependent transcriptional regulator [Aestuariirhabdus haliotis]MCL6420279.1 sigma-54 dependent transcriptional regulator [Aestuariirhabdus haliotis]
MAQLLPFSSVDIASDSLHRIPVCNTRISSILLLDEGDEQQAIVQSLKFSSGLFEQTTHLETARALLKRCHFDLIVVNLDLFIDSNEEWERILRHYSGHTDIICLSEQRDSELAIRVLRSGGADLLHKPCTVNDVMSSVQYCLERRSKERQSYLRSPWQQEKLSQSELIGESTAIVEVTDIISRVAPTPSTILIQGESGTGKELAARAVHLQSGRKGPFVAINCSAIAADLMESELFGHHRGAFTGAQQARDGLFVHANGGTLFLDEIGEMPLAMQAKLLRALEERCVRPVGGEKQVPVDVRIVAATNRNLEQESRSGNFREDLYYRINILTLTMPPLRDRPEDIPPLVHHFVSKLSAELSVPEIPLSHADLSQLQQHDWPGNIRELSNFIERCLLLGKLPLDYLRQTHLTPANAPGKGYPSEWDLEKVIKHHSLQVLEQAGGNKSEAARQLGVSRKTLERKLQAWAKLSAEN